MMKIMLSGFAVSQTLLAWILWSLREITYEQTVVFLLMSVVAAVLSVTFRD